MIRIDTEPPMTSGETTITIPLDDDFPLVHNADLLPFKAIDGGAPLVIPLGRAASYSDLPRSQRIASDSPRAAYWGALLTQHVTHALDGAISLSDVSTATFRDIWQAIQLVLEILRPTGREWDAIVSAYTSYDSVEINDGSFTADDRQVLYDAGFDLGLVVSMSLSSTTADAASCELINPVVPSAMMVQHMKAYDVEGVTRLSVSVDTRHELLKGVFGDESGTTKAPPPPIAQSVIDNLAILGTVPLRTDLYGTVDWTAARVAAMSAALSTVGLGSPLGFFTRTSTAMLKAERDRLATQPLDPAFPNLTIPSR